MNNSNSHKIPSHSLNKLNGFRLSYAIPCILAYLPVKLDRRLATHHLTISSINLGFLCMSSIMPFSCSLFKLRNKGEENDFSAILHKSAASTSLLLSINKRIFAR